MVRSGEVVQTNGKHATVVFDRPKACENCNGCLGRQCTHVEIEVCAEVGDIIEVQMPDQNILKASAIAYLLPVLLLATGLLLGEALHAPLSIPFSKDLFAALCAILSSLIGLLLARAVDHHLSGKTEWKPEVLSVYKKEKMGI